MYISFFSFDLVSYRDPINTRRARGGGRARAKERKRERQGGKEKLIQRRDSTDVFSCTSVC